MQSYFVVPESIRLNSTHDFIIKIPNKQDLQQITFKYSWDTGFRDSIFTKSISQNHILF